MQNQFQLENPYSFYLVNKNNIFAKPTLEWLMVEAIIKAYEEKSSSPTLVIWSNSKSLNSMIVKFLVELSLEHQVELNLDSYTEYFFPQRAIWYARLSGCLAPTVLSEFEGPVFGLFVESGFNNVWKDELAKQQLIEKGPNIKQTEHLLKVAKISSKIRQKCFIPDLDYSNGKIKINNVSAAPLNYENHSPPLYQIDYLPFNTRGYQNIVDAETRGIFHHTGDEMAFLLAAVKVGTCFILGQDEFGDLMILNAVGKDFSFFGNYTSAKSNREQSYFLSFINKKASVLSFDYIYGVARTNSCVPNNSNNTFGYSRENRVFFKGLGDVEPSLSYNYWNNPAFLKHANRNIREMTFKELVFDFSQAIKKVCIFNMETNKLMDFIVLPAHPEFSETLLKRIADFSERMQDASIDFMSDMLALNFSFFIKSIAPKSHCLVINPPSNIDLSFFKKNTSESVDFPNKIYFDRIICFASDYYRFVKQKQGIDILFSDFIEDEEALSAFLSSFITEPDGLSLKVNKSFSYWYKSSAPSFIKSDIVPMKYEYRFFVANGKIAAGTPCFRNTTPFNCWNRGRLDPRLADGHNAIDTLMNSETRKIVAMYANKGRQIVKDIVAHNPKNNNFVLDVCLSSDKDGNPCVTPIEINSLAISGAYQVDFRRVCLSFAKKPLHQHEVNKMKLSYGKILEKTNVSMDFKKKNNLESKELLPKSHT